MIKQFTKKNIALVLTIFFMIILFGIGILLGKEHYLLKYFSTIHYAIRADSSITGLLISETIQIFIALCGIIPASISAISAGMLYGLWKGFFISASATLIGATLSFFLSRSIFRSSIETILKRSPKMNKLDHLLYIDGWKLVCLLRISPIMPFALTSYTLGLTSISFRSYFIGTLASLPALFGYVLMGYLTHNEANTLKTEHITSIKHLLFAITFIGTIILLWHLKKIIHKVLKLPSDTSQNNP